MAWLSASTRGADPKGWVLIALRRLPQRPHLDHAVRDRTRSPRGDLDGFRQARRIDNGESGYGKGRRHERPVLGDRPGRVVVAHLDGLPGDTHLYSLLAEVSVVRMRRIPYGRVGPVIARLVAVADGYELRHLKLLSCTALAPSRGERGASGELPGLTRGANMRGDRRAAAG